MLFDAVSTRDNAGLLLTGYMGFNWITCAAVATQPYGAEAVQEHRDISADIDIEIPDSCQDS